MDQLFLSLQKRFLVPIVIVGSLLAWLILCHANYKSYWYGTIYRVQTTDFNILHHSLPPTLSRMILEGKSELVQKTLDSTYGLFGLVITDPEGQTVLWQTNKVYHRESWHKKINPEYLNNLKEPFDLLTAPAVLEPEPVGLALVSAQVPAWAGTDWGQPNCQISYAGTLRQLAVVLAA